MERIGHETMELGELPSGGRVGARQDRSVKSRQDLVVEQPVHLTIHYLGLGEAAALNRDEAPPQLRARSSLDDPLPDRPSKADLLLGIERAIHLAPQQQEAHRGAI